jgi:hypothetical protein
VVRVQVENLGTRELVEGHSYELLREEGGVWVPVNGASSGEEAWSQSSIYGGLTGSCQRIMIPEDAATGRYRVTKRPWVDSSKRILDLSGTFRVG